MHNKMLVVIVLLLVTSCAKPDWSGIATPTKNPPQIYGSYSAGCIDGAVAMPEEGVGYQGMNRLRNRFYGHPSMINFIEKFSRKVDSKYGRKILVNDIGQPRGGPAPLNSSVHVSHQIGLDADIWFKTITRGSEVSDIDHLSVLADDQKSLNLSRWNNNSANILKTAARFDEVERILVNPAVKKAMCEKYKGAKWLNKIRPWWGHDSHFHVRLVCPASDAYCVKQRPVPVDDGCGADMDWWFSAEAQEAGREKYAAERVYPKLPEMCEQVFDWKNKGK